MLGRHVSFVSVTSGGLVEICCTEASLSIKYTHFSFVLLRPRIRRSVLLAFICIRRVFFTFRTVPVAMTERCNADVLPRQLRKPLMFPFLHKANEVPRFWSWRNYIILFKFDRNCQKFAILNFTPKYCCFILLAIVPRKSSQFPVAAWM